MIVSGGDQRRDNWLYGLNGVRNATLFIAVLLVASIFREDMRNTYLRRTIVAEIVALLLLALAWMLWQRAGMPRYAARVRELTRNGAKPSYNFHTTTNNWVAFIATLFISIFVSAVITGS